MEIKNILLALRKEQGLSQDEMAEKLFVTRQAVSRWETGETEPSIDTLKVMSRVFGVPIGGLLGLENDTLCMFKRDQFSFSYRIAGILVRNGAVLLQKPRNAEFYAFPGGIVRFGETTVETLTRRWREEMGAEIEVGELKWVEENLFFLDGKPCQQISLDYVVHLKDGENAPENGFAAHTYAADAENAVQFYWIPLHEVQNLEVYPQNAAELLQNLDGPLQHIVYEESN